MLDTAWDLYIEPRVLAEELASSLYVARAVRPFSFKREGDGGYDSRVVVACDGREDEDVSYDSLSTSYLSLDEVPGFLE
jgi:hypothetical protein